MPKMTLDEAVNVLDEWDRDLGGSGWWRWKLEPRAEFIRVSIGLGLTMLDERKHFLRRTHNLAILAAARWAKKEMEKKR